MTTHLNTRDLNMPEPECKTLAIGDHLSPWLEEVDCRDCIDHLITGVCASIERLLAHPSGTPGKRSALYDLKEAANRRLMALDHLARARELAHA